ncbi:MAG: pseudouridine synthase [Lachnospiraceae bacterium]|nr:pseudouridine synthase [Lachnospiraceae bacterium]
MDTPSGSAGKGIRLNKYLSEAGICSRREADRLIAAGEVTVDGVTASVGMSISGTEKIIAAGKPVSLSGKKEIVLAVNKPRGVVCTTDRRWDDRLLEDLIHEPYRVFSVGRLDKDSEGLILMTNEGDLLNRIMKSENRHEKEYEVSVDHPVSQEHVRLMEKGLYLPEIGRTTRPCRIIRKGPCEFRMILTQGLNRQIRRMFAVFGYQVIRLRRIRIMNIRLGDLPVGKYRELTPAELSELKRALAGSSNNTEFRYRREDRNAGEN